jgi:hypothetical protein
VGWVTHDAPMARLGGGLILGLIASSWGVVSVLSAIRNNSDIKRVFRTAVLAVLAVSVVGIWIWPPLPTG